MENTAAKTELIDLIHSLDIEDVVITTLRNKRTRNLMEVRVQIRVKQKPVLRLVE